MQLTALSFTLTYGNATRWRSAIELLYANNKLKRQLSSKKEIQKAFGKNADRVEARVNALRAFDTLGEVKQLDPKGRWHSLTGKRSGQWAGDTSNRHRIIIRPESNDIELSDDEDASTATVLDCNENYHEK